MHGFNNAQIHQCTNSPNALHRDSLMDGITNARIHQWTDALCSGGEINVCSVSIDASFATVVYPCNHALVKRYRH